MAERSGVAQYEVLPVEKQTLGGRPGDAGLPIGPYLPLRHVRGEVLGLRWHDIDFEHRQLRIRQQIQRIQGELHIGPVKTKAGNRDMPHIA